MSPLQSANELGIDDGAMGIVQLEGYINPTVARLGLFADDTDPYEWTFLKENDERQRFDPITRSQFERELGVETTLEIPHTANSNWTRSGQYN